MRTIKTLFEQLQTSTIKKIAEHIYLANSVLELNDFPINKYLKKYGIDTFDWKIIARFDRSFYTKVRIDKDGHIMEVCIVKTGNSPEYVINSIEHEITHVIDNLKSIQKNKGKHLDNNFRKQYTKNPLSYYKYPQEFNQLIHYLQQLSTKTKFRTYEDLIEYLSNDENTFINKKMIKDISFKKRLLSRLYREKIDIIKQIKKPTNDSGPKITILDK